MARVLQPFCLDAGLEGDQSAGDTLVVGVDITAAQAVALAAAGHIALEAVSADDDPDPTLVLAAAGRNGAVRVVAMGGFSLGGGADVAPGSALLVNEDTAVLWEKQGRAVRAPAMVISADAALGHLLVGDVVSVTLAIAGGVAPYVLSETEDSDGLPAGLTFTAGTGVIAGTTTTAGAALAFEVQVVDSRGDSATGQIAVQVAEPLEVSPASLSAVTTEDVVDVTVEATGGYEPYAFTAVGMPSGMTLGEATGALDWATPLAAGSPHAFTVTVTDSAGHEDEVEYSLVVTEP